MSRDRSQHPRRRSKHGSHRQRPLADGDDSAARRRRGGVRSEARTTGRTHWHARGRQGRRVHVPRTSTRRHRTRSDPRTFPELTEQGHTVTRADQLGLPMTDARSALAVISIVATHNHAHSRRLFFGPGLGADARRTGCGRMGAGAAPLLTSRTVGSRIAGSARSSTELRRIATVPSTTKTSPLWLERR